jgi:hypothetical protein
MQCLDIIAAREFLVIQRKDRTLASRHRSGEYGDWAVLNHYNTGEATCYVFSQLTSVMISALRWSRSRKHRKVVLKTRPQ